MAEIIEVPWELNPEEITSGLKSDVLLLEPRSPGLHLSDLIRDLENTVIKPGERLADVDMSDEDRATMNRYREMGMLWEIVMEAVFKQRRIENIDPKKFLRQVEKLYDGVYSTIDLIHIPDWRVIETKLTTRSSNRATLDRFEQEFFGWFAQIKWNCLAHETRLASFFVMFTNGNYHPPVPQTKRFDCIFNEEELWDNHRMLKNQEAVMRKEGRLPSLAASKSRRASSSSSRRTRRRTG